MGDSPTRTTSPKGARPAFLDSPIEDALGLHARRDPTEPEDDFGYRFYVDVLGLEHVHYGLWAGEPLTLAGFRVAQQRYAEALADLFPVGVTSVLDVGCGTGGNAAGFAARGYEVEGLSPDPFHGRLFREATHLPFHECRFEDFRSARRYDAICMSESSQYVPLDRLFDSAIQALEPGGYLILSDYFALVKDGSSATRSGHLLSAFVAAAEQSGMQVEYERDVTEETAPTLDLGCHLLDHYIVPTVRLTMQRWRLRHPHSTENRPVVGEAVPGKDGGAKGNAGQPHLPREKDLPDVPLPGAGWWSRPNPPIPASGLDQVSERRPTYSWVRALVKPLTIP